MSLCSQKVGGRKSRVPEEQASGRPSALTFPLHACPSVPAESGVNFISEEGSFCYYFYQHFANFLRTGASLVSLLLGPRSTVPSGDRFSGEIRALTAEFREVPCSTFLRETWIPWKQPQEGSLMILWLVVPSLLWLSLQRGRGLSLDS